MKRRVGIATIAGIFAATLWIAILAGARTALADGANLLANPDFAKGSGESPDDWRTEAWVNNPDAFKPHFARPEETGGAAELRIESAKANDARWMQSLSLKPGWYYLSVELRTSEVGADQTGATISVMEDGIMSPDVRGTADWQRVGLYLKVGGRGADIDVALRLGGYGSLNIGKAYFRDARLERVDAPPPNATPTYDLAAIRKGDAHIPTGSPITLIAVFALLALAAWVGWRLAGPDDDVLPPGCAP